jgi:hypothetical protein
MMRKLQNTRNTTGQSSRGKLSIPAITSSLGRPWIRFPTPGTLELEVVARGLPVGNADQVHALVGARLPIAFDGGALQRLIVADHLARPVADHELGGRQQGEHADRHLERHRGTRRGRAALAAGRPRRPPTTSAGGQIGALTMCVSRAGKDGLKITWSQSVATRRTVGSGREAVGVCIQLLAR